MKLFDAHNHLHDERLAPHRANILAALAPLDVAGAVVNGTREDDWEAVAALARELPWVPPSYGLHPWHAPQRGPWWLEELRRRLDGDPRAAVGEIGLDRWIKGHDLDDQRAAFTAQLALAARRIASDDPLSGVGRCEIVRASLPRRGFHSPHSGPWKWCRFVDLGALFVPPYFLHEQKAAQREVFRQAPRTACWSTDAPDLRPPTNEIAGRCARPASR